MTISGVKDLISTSINKLDDHNVLSLKADYYKKSLNEKSKSLLDKINRIKKYTKKTHLKVRMVPESNPDSKFIYYAKKPTKGERLKIN